MLAERIPGRGEHRVGEVHPLAVEAHQPRDVDHPVVHRPPLRAPRHRARRALEQGVGAGDPPRPDIQPGAMRQHGPAHGRRQRPQACLVRRVKQRALECGLHACDYRRLSNTYSRARTPPGSGHGWTPARSRSSWPGTIAVTPDSLTGPRARHADVGLLRKRWPGWRCPRTIPRRTPPTWQEALRGALWEKNLGLILPVAVRG